MSTTLVLHSFYVTVGAVPPDAQLQAPTAFTFGPGQPTIQCLNININSDTVTEGGEVVPGECSKHHSSCVQCRPK